MSTELTAEILSALEARHVAFVEARLVSEEAAKEWRDNLSAVARDLLAAKVSDLGDAHALADALEAALTGTAVSSVARPLVKQLVPLVLAELELEKGKVGDRVPAAARDRLYALVSRPGTLPERLLREIVQQDAVDEIMRDVLYDGFKEFSEKVNPFTAEWGIPSLLKRISVFGGAMAKGIETVKLDFDKRLEPELRRFLAGFSKRGLDRMVDVTVARADQPASIAFRRHLVTWLLEQDIAALARDADQDAIAIVQELALDLVATELDRPAGKARRREVLAALVEGAKDQTVGEVLASLGVHVTVDEDAIARASWPFARAVMASPAVRAVIARLAREFYDAERAQLAR